MPPRGIVFNPSHLEKINVYLFTAKSLFPLSLLFLSLSRSISFRSVTYRHFTSIQHRVRLSVFACVGVEFPMLPVLVLMEPAKRYYYYSRYYYAAGQCLFGAHNICICCSCWATAKKTNQKELCYR